MDRWIALDPLCTRSLTSFLSVYRGKFSNTQHHLVAKPNQLFLKAFAVLCRTYALQEATLIEMNYLLQCYKEAMLSTFVADVIFRAVFTV